MISSKSICRILENLISFRKIKSNWLWHTQLMHFFSTGWKLRYRNIDDSENFGWLGNFPILIITTLSVTMTGWFSTNLSKVFSEILKSFFMWNSERPFLSLTISESQNVNDFNPQKEVRLFFSQFFLMKTIYVELLPIFSYLNSAKPRSQIFDFKGNFGCEKEWIAFKNSSNKENNSMIDKSF